MASEQADSAAGPIIEVRNLSKSFPLRQGIFGGRRTFVHAVDDVSFALEAGKTLGIVGESGCGKSTTARMMVRLTDPTSGSILFKGVDITQLPPREMRAYRSSIQFVFQDPYSSLNPRMNAGEIVGEPLQNFGIATGRELRQRIEDLFSRVGLRKDLIDRYPHEFSGGQRQRLGIARALALSPDIIVADEPVSALDVSVQAQVINLMIDLQEEFGLGYVFIAHDLAVVQHISHRVAVMYLGKIVEIADTDLLFASPQHPYTEALLDAVPVPDPARRHSSRVLTGEIPSPINPPSGCRFRTRCPLAIARCSEEVPAVREIRPNHWVACHLRQQLNSAKHSTAEERDGHTARKEK